LIVSLTWSTMGLTTTTAVRVAVGSQITK